MLLQTPTRGHQIHLSSWKPTTQEIFLTVCKQFKSTVSVIEIMFNPGCMTLLHFLVCFMNYV